MEFSEIINNRRAINFFDPSKDLSDKLLENIIDMASHSPSSFNLQPWSLIVLKDKADKLRLEKLAMNQAKVSLAPVTLIVLADKNGWQEGHRFVEKNFQEMIKAGLMDETRRIWFKNARENLYGSSEQASLAFACKNAGFFAMALMFAAKNFGVETHPMDGFDHEKVRKEFNIPDNYWIPLLIAMGYSDTSKAFGIEKWGKNIKDIIVRFDN